jgi:hypothetical protein
MTSKKSPEELEREAILGQTAGGIASKKPDPPTGPTPAPPGVTPPETEPEEEPIKLRMNSEDFEPEFGPEAYRDGEQSREKLLDSLPSGPIQVLKLSFIDQIKDEYDDGGNYVGSGFIPNYVAITKYERATNHLFYVKLKDKSEHMIPWARIAHAEVFKWSKSKPE